MLEALNANVLQATRAGPVMLAMQTMMSVVEREFTDGEGGYTHEELIEQGVRCDPQRQAGQARAGGFAR